LMVKFINYGNNIEAAKNLNSINGDQTFGETTFSDMDPQEFSRMYLTFAVDQDSLAKAAQGSENLPTVETETTGRNLKQRNLLTYPAAFDWRSKSVITVPSDQGQCGSCWSFATAAVLEGVYKIKYGYLYKFSEQQLVDCNTQNYGCNGGNVGVAFNYLYNVGGLQTQSTYGAYLGYRSTCRFSASKAVAQVSSWFYPGTNEVTIRNYLYSYGPLAVAINADPLQYYQSGVINLSNCSTTLNHAVTLIGYGTANGLDYWVVKNSWGSVWGENGFFRMARGVGMCGINLFAVGAILA